MNGNKYDRDSGTHLDDDEGNEREVASGAGHDNADAERINLFKIFDGQPSVFFLPSSDRTERQNITSPGNSSGYRWLDASISVAGGAGVGGGGGGGGGLNPPYYPCNGDGYTNVVTCNVTSVDDYSSLLFDVLNSTADSAASLDPYSAWQLVVLAVLAGCMSLVTIVGNLIVILSFFIERTIRQPTNYFIASLAVSDLFIGRL